MFIGTVEEASAFLAPTVWDLFLGTIRKSNVILESQLNSIILQFLLERLTSNLL